MRGSKAAIQRRSSMPPEDPCPGQTCVPARVRMPAELMTAAGVGAGDSAGAGDGAGTGGERGAGGTAAGGQAAPPTAELAAALWSLASLPLSGWDRRHRWPARGPQSRSATAKTKPDRFWAGLALHQ